MTVIAATWVWPLAALLVLVALALVLDQAWRRRSLAFAFVGVTVVFAGLWLLAYAALRTNYEDAGGWVDCWPGCTTYQYTVATTFWYGPVVYAALTAFAAVLVLPLGIVSSALLAWLVVCLAFALRWWGDGLGDARPVFGAALAVAALAGAAAGGLVRRRSRGIARAAD